MEKLEIKKSIERTKAILICSIIFLILLVPTFIFKLTEIKKIFFLTLTSFVIMALYKRVRWLNFKLKSLIK